MVRCCLCDEDRQHVVTLPGGAVCQVCTIRAVTAFAKARAVDPAIPDAAEAVGRRPLFAREC